MKNYTVIFTDSNANNSPFVYTVSGFDPRDAFVNAAKEYHSGQYVGWSPEQIEEDGDEFDEDDYICVAVYEGHHKNLYTEWY